MKEIKFYSLVLIFWFSFLMWLGFANGIINGLNPVRGITESFDVFKVFYETLFYFGPHLIIAILILVKYCDEPLEKEADP